MFSTYVNLSEQDIDNEFLKRAGVEVEEEAPAGMRPITCGECNTTNMPGNDFCYKCGYPISEEARKSIVSKEDIVKASPEYTVTLEEYQKLEDRMLRLEKMLDQK